FVGQKWWHTRKQTTGRRGPPSELFWARLDIRLAFPSCRLDYLTSVLSAAAEAPLDVADFCEFFPGPTPADPYLKYTSDLRNALHDSATRSVLASQLGAALGAIEYEPSPRPRSRGGGLATAAYPK